MGTYGGTYFDLLNPTPEAVSLETVAHSLSRLARFNGHLTQTYSVAQHSLQVALILWEETRSAYVALQGLHHDSHEAYLGDWPTPVKRLFAAKGADLESIEGPVRDAVRDCFGVPRELDPRVHGVDWRVTYSEHKAWGHPALTEWHGDDPVVISEPHSADRVKWWFMRMHRELVHLADLEAEGL